MKSEGVGEGCGVEGWCLGLRRLRSEVET